MVNLYIVLCFVAAVEFDINCQPEDIRVYNSDRCFYLCKLYN